jgi:hypothetical protein
MGPPAPTHSALLFGAILRRCLFDPLAREGDEGRSRGQKVTVEREQQEAQ